MIVQLRDNERRYLGNGAEETNSEIREVRPMGLGD